MSYPRLRRVNIRQASSLVLALVIWMNYVCLIGHGRGLSAPPADTPRVSNSTRQKQQQPPVNTARADAPDVKPGRVGDGQASRVRASETYGKLPLGFEINKGQTDSRVRFLARGSGYNLFLTPTEAVIVLSRRAQGKRGLGPARAAAHGKRAPEGAVLRMSLVGANTQPNVTGVDEMPGKSNYFIGSDPKGWQTDVPSYLKVKYESVYQGVDLLYYGNQRQLEHDFIIAPGTDPGIIKLNFNGARSTIIDNQGDLVLKVKGGEVRQSKPVAYQEVEGRRREVSARYVMRGKRQIGFEVGGYDTTRPLVIDPVLIYSTYLGGSGEERGQGIAVDSSGNAYVTGFTLSPNFPLSTTPYRATLSGTQDAFVTKLSANGATLVYSTYLGGRGVDAGNGIAVDASGNAYIVGSTASTDFPTLNYYQRLNGGGDDAFVTKLNATGSALVYSTYLGGSLSDYAYDIAIDSAGVAYVVGEASSTNFPTLGAYQATNGGGSDGFLTKFNASGNTLAYSTLIGGSQYDCVYGVAVDSAGSAYVTGRTGSTNFPTVNPLQANHRGGNDAFITKFNTSGNSLVYSTYLGGGALATWPDTYSGDWGEAIAVDAQGNAYVVGSASTTDFPTQNGIQYSYGGGLSEGFIAKYNPTGTAYGFVSYLGGSTNDSADDIALDSDGNILITGYTTSVDFPLANPLQTTRTGAEVYVAKLTPDGNSFVYSTYLGGAGSDYGKSLAVDSSGNAYVTGFTSSTNFPTRNPARPSNGGGSFDSFVLKITNQSGYAISGRVADDAGTPASGVTLTLGGAQSGATTTDANGNYSFVNLPAGDNYTVTPSKAGYTFVPSVRTFNVLSADQTADFTVQLFSISGRVADAGGTGVNAVTMTLSGGQSATAQTDSLGNYTFSNLPVGNYTVTPSKSDPVLTYTFTPPSRSYTNMSSSQVADFTSAATTQSTLYPTADAHVQDGASASTNFGTATTMQVRTDSVVNSGSNRDAYLKFDLSAVARNITNVKLRVYAALSAAGSVNTSVYSVSNTTWAERGTGGITWNNKPVPGSTALAGATVTVNSTAYTAYDIDLTTYIKAEKDAGRDVVSLALRNPAATTLITSLNSRESAANKPQLIVTTSNATNTPPAVSLTAPANGANYTAPANITISANASDSDGISKVEFFAGTTLLGASTASPYQITWSNVAAGSYALFAVATDRLGASTSSNVSNITVGLSNSAPAVSLASPIEGTTFSAGSSISVKANATDADGTISKVEFFAGTTLIGTATTPASGSLYSITWNNVNSGGYAITAKATDNAGVATTSGAVNINVVSQTGLSPTADAYVRDGSSAAANFGTAVDLQAQVSATTGNNRETYLKYDLTSVGGVAQAKVRLYGRLNDTSAANVLASIYPVATTTWTETGVTWNTKPVAGASPLASVTVTNNVAQWYEWDVTSYVKAEKVAGRNVVSFVVKGTAASNTFITFNAREATTNRPQLLLRTTQARNALLITNSATLGAGDAAVRTRLQNLGFTVTVLAATKATSVTGAEADGKAIVLISSTVTPAYIANKFRNAAVPVVIWEFDLLDDQGMTGTVSGTDFGTAATQTQVAILNSAHPMAAGLTGNVAVSASSTFTWGKPNANAVKIAALTTDATKILIFGYDSMAAMPGLEAPARRVSMFMSDTTAGSFTTQGGALFDAVIKWATETITAPTITSLTPASGPAGTSVTVRGINFGATQGGSTLTFNGVASTITSWNDGAVVTAVPSYATTGTVVVTVGGVASNGIVFTVGATDTDGDGLPDNWELQYFGNLGQGANGDADGDGLTNLQEYRQGRNPTKNALADNGDFVNLKVYTPLRP